jgi:hypothetical protein
MVKLRNAQMRCICCKAGGSKESFGYVTRHNVDEVTVNVLVAVSVVYKPRLTRQ